jgi:Fe/S biogenesis protein NfuA
MESPILTLTEAATAKIKDLQASQETKEMPIRVAVREDSPAAFRYLVRFVPLEDKKAEDETVDVDGILFYIDGESVPLLAGSTLDFVDTLLGTGFKFDNPNKPPLLKDPIAARVHQIIEERINPSLATHGGRVALLDYRDGKVYVQLGGGCQGCGMVDVTLKQGIEATLKEEIPEVTEVLDTTDHASGTNPYHQPGK